MLIMTSSGVVLLLTVLHILAGEEVVVMEETNSSSTPGQETTADTEPVDQPNSPAYRDSVKLVLEDFELSILKSESLQLNSSAENASEAAAASQRPKLNCLPSYQEAAAVSLLNATELQARLAEESSPSVANRTFPANCSLTFFYASWCEFSAAAAPHYNALARFFPRMRMFAVDSATNHIINAQYGVISVPTLLVFHNGRPMYRFNHSEYSLAKYKEFVVHLTAVEPENVSMQLTLEDYQGPVPTVAVKGFNYNLLVAALFILACGLVDLSRTSACRGLIDTLRNAWREAEIQHEHAD